LFEVAKFLTMEVVFEQYLAVRVQGSIGGDDKVAKTKSLELNVMEATLTDEAKQNLDNTYAGKTLLASHIKSCEMTRDGKLALKHIFTPGWSVLYETWNLCFCVGNIGAFFFLLAFFFLPLSLIVFHAPVAFR